LWARWRLTVRTQPARSHDCACTERRRALDQMATDAEDDDLCEITLDSRPSR